MAHIFEYAILTAIPDERRGERVNVGIVVFLPDSLDIRFSDLRKIKALAEGNWEEYARDVRARLISGRRPGEKPADLLSRFSVLEGVIRFSAISWFSIDRPEEFDSRVSEIIYALVQRRQPAPERRREGSTRINTQIAKVFRSARVLARPGEGMAHGKVERNVRVSVEDDLTADFGVKNGVYRITATLDLRRANADKGQAALKSITLDNVKKVFGSDARTFGVFAAPAGDAQFAPLIHMFKGYADQAFNWSEPSERTAYLHAIYQGLRGDGAFHND